MRHHKTFIHWLVLLVLLCSIPAQANDNSDLASSGSAFVQSFYNWYVLNALSNHSGKPWDLTLKSRSSDFDPRLAQALKDDSAAQAESPEEIVGLDFDPFVNSQDPAEHYEAGAVARKGQNYWVDVYGVWSGKKSEKPDVVVELMQKNGHWLLVNFHYPGDEDLLAALASLQASREKPSK